VQVDGDKHDLQRLILVLLALGAASVSACRESPRYACESCNVVLVSIDTLRADHVGAYGYTRPTTPNIDAVADRGILFENAISQSSWTRPAHMSMFTGLHPAEHGYVGLIDRGRLPASTPTLAGVLRARGYATVAFTGGVNVAATYGFDQGFDSYRSNGKHFRDNLEETRYWLAEHATEPFFLFWHGYDAHTPYANDPVDRRALGVESTRQRIGLRRLCRDKKTGVTLQRVLDEYDAAVHRADRYVGKLLAELEARGGLDRTVVVIVSDHGEEFLDHGRCFHLNTLYREVLHVPFVVRAPGLAPRRIESLVPASVSVGATILDLVGAREHPLPGPSLAGAITGGETRDYDVVSETRRRQTPKHGHGHLRSLTRATDKLIDWITLGRREWFDRTADPLEHSPVSSGREVDHAAAALVRWSERHPRKFHADAAASGAAGATRESDQQLERELRSLGYVE
jgi:arylsulfatase A-like enzyme